MNVLFPLPVVKRFLQIVHLLYSVSTSLPYLTLKELMSFADSPHLGAKNQDNILDLSLPEKKFDHVMCFGTFDIFHPGHCYYLSTAQKFAHTMTVVIARDHRVMSGKGKNPIHDEMVRLENVQNAFPQARVILGDEHDIFAPLRTYQPDLLAFGYDQRVPEDRIIDLFPHMQIIRVGGFETDTWKSSILRNKL